MAALRKNPILPLYVQDFITDERLVECSPAAVGIYIWLMCLLHKSSTYGSMDLRDKDQLTEDEILELSEICHSKIDSKNKNLPNGLLIQFAKKLQKSMPFDIADIVGGLAELVDEEVITLDGNRLYQRRMVKDGEISEKRSNSGLLGANQRYRKTGGGEICHSKTDSKSLDFAIAKPIANGIAKPIAPTKNLLSEGQNKENEKQKEKENAPLTPYKEKEKEKEKEPLALNAHPRKTTAKKVFIKPTVEEVREYCTQRGNNVDAEKFVDFYEANGWVQGRQGKPLKDWKAAVRTWEQSSKYYDRATNTAAPGKLRSVHPAAEETKTRRTTI